MHRRFPFLVVLCATTVSASFSVAANVLQNADFELNESGGGGWRVTVGTTRYTVVNDPVRGGNCIEGTEPEPGASLGRYIQDVGAKVVPGQRYRLAGWIKTTDVRSSGGVVIGMGTVNADGALIPGSFQREIGRVKGTTDWTFFDSGDFILPELTPGTVSYAVYLDFNGDGGGTARFDEISLTTPSKSNWFGFGANGTLISALGGVAFLTISALLISALRTSRNSGDQ